MDRSRLISLVVAAVYVAVFASMTVSEAACDKPSAEQLFETVVSVLFWLVFSLACIWWGDELGEGLTGVWFGFRQITASSPGPAVTLMGWIILLLPGMLMLLARGGVLNRLI